MCNNLRLLAEVAGLVYDKLGEGVFAEVTNLWNDVGRHISDLRSAITGLGSELWNQVGTYVYENGSALDVINENLWNSIGWYVDQNRQVLYQNLYPKLTEIESHAWEILLDLDSIDDAMWNRVGQYAQGTQQAVGNIPDWLWNQVGTYSRNTWTQMGVERELVETAVREYNQATAGRVVEVRDRLYSDVGQYASGTHNVLHQTVAPQLQQSHGLLQSISEGLSSGLEAVRNSVVGLPDLLGGVIENVVTPAISWIWEQLTRLWNWVESNIPPLIQRGLTGVWKAIGDAFQEFGMAGIRAMTEFLGRNAPVTPEQAPALATDLLGMTMSFGLGARGMATAMEVLHPLKRLNLHTFSGFLADMGNFGGIATATLGVLIAASVRQPYQYYANAVFRPRIPDDYIVREMYIKGDIDRDMFLRAMQYAGYSDQWIAAWERTMYREPSIMDLNRFAEESPQTYEWYFEKMRRAQYSEEDAAIMADGLVLRFARAAKQEYRSNILTAFKEGYLSETQFDSLMDEINAPQVLRGILKASALLKERTDFTTDSIRLYVDQFYKGELTVDELKLSLAALGITPKRVDLLVARAEIRKKPKPTWPTWESAAPEVTDITRRTLNLLRLQYRKKLISQSQFQNSLLELGIKPALVEVIIDTELAYAGQIRE